MVFTVVPRRVLTDAVVVTSVLFAGCSSVEISGPNGEGPGWQPPVNQGGQVSVTSEWRDVVAPGRRLEIKGVSGSIRAMRAAGTEVVITATKVGSPDAVDDVTVGIVRHEAGVTVCAVYPDVAGQAPNRCAPGNDGNMTVWEAGRHRVRVDFTVQVPDGVTLVGRTLAGDLEATSLRSDVFLTTMTGDINVSTTRTATGATVTGDIVASIGMTDWERDLSFSAMNGNIDVTIRPTANAEIWAIAAFGDVISDFTLHKVAPGELRGRIGGGGPTLRLSTLSGDITLRKGAEGVFLNAAHGAGDR